MAGVITMMAPETLGRLLDTYAAALTLYARQWCRTPDDAVQEAFVKLAALAVAPPRVAPWLFAVVRNAAISAGRAERRRRHHESVAAARNAAWFAPTEGRGLDAAIAAHALAELPGEEREAIVAHLWGGLTFEDVGRLMNLSAATAHRRYTAGLERLRETLRVECPPPPIPT